MKTRFVYLKSLGYIALDDVIQVYNPNGQDINLEGLEIAVRFVSPVYDHNGNVVTNVVKLTDRAEIVLLIKTLGLLQAQEVEPKDSIGE